MSDVNKLWVHVSRLGEGNLFELYPRLLREVMEAAKSSSNLGNYDLILPSDATWRDRIYYKLVQKQRKINLMPNPRPFLDLSELKPSPWDTRIPVKPAKKHPCTPYGLLKASHGSISSTSQIIWLVSDVVKAARLLSQPPMDVCFGNEHEMRRVYSLIYDVFRYKNILNQALTDVTFFHLFPDYRCSCHVVWLLLYELYCRRFRERSVADQQQCKTEWCKCEILPILEEALWELRVKLAASISRLRIAHNALHLNDMLPTHLRDEKVHKNSSRQPLTAWVNKFKVNCPIDIVLELNNEINLVPVDYGKPIVPGKYAWDSLCPMVLCFHQSDRIILSQCPPVKQHRLIIQDRSFAYGPAMFCKILFEMELSGTVVMTHVTSPRSIAYFAALLSQNDNIFSLLVFGAGDRKFEFDQYMTALGIDNILIYAKKFNEMDMNAEILENVVAIFATPPNSHSAVADPIDLVCGRGGDLLMLEILTDDAQTNDGEKRVSAMLEEQRQTLALAMSRPQIQFVLYETHSQIPAENEQMVKHVIVDVNMAARRVHAKLEPAPLPQYARPKEINNNEPTEKKSETEINNNEIAEEASEETSNVIEESVSEESVESQHEEVYKHIEIPPTDEFELSALPDLCFNSDSCIKFKEEGCYLAYIKRKEVINLNSKYMIQMAETRGLFGANMGESSNQRKVQKTPRARRKVASGKQKRRQSFEVERIAAPTNNSLIRSYNVHKCDRCHMDSITCPRHKEAVTSKTNITATVSPARQWWAETTRYLTRLKRSLIRQKIISDRLPVLKKLLPDDDKVLKDIHNIDEVLTRVPKVESSNAKIPPFPRLRLSRTKSRNDRIPFPVYNCYVELPEKKY